MKRFSGFCFLVLWLGLISIPTQAQGSEIIRLEKELSNAKSDTQKLRLYTELNWLYLYENKDKAKEYAQKQLDLADQKGLKKELAQGYNDMGLVAYRQSQFLVALDWYQKSLQIRETRKDEYGMASSWSKIGVCYAEIGDYPHALEAQLKALPLFEKIKNTAAVALTLSNLCANYVWLKQWDQLEKTADKSLKLSTEIQDSAGIASSLSYLATAYGRKGRFTKACELERQVLAIYTNRKDTVLMLAAMNNLAFDLGEDGKVLDCRNMYSEALELAKVIWQTPDIIQLSTNLASEELDLGRIAEAEELLNEAKFLSTKENLPEHLPQIYRTFGDLYLAKGQTKQAAKAFNDAATLQDSLFSEKVALQYSNLQTAYDIAKKEKEKELLQKDNELKENQLWRQRWLFFSLGLGLISILIWLFFKNQQKLLKMKQQQETDRHEIQEQLAKDILDAEEKERSRIARELHDGIGQQLVAAHLNLASLEVSNADQNELLANTRSLVEDSLSEVRSVSHIMLSNALLRSGLAGAVRDFVQKIKQNLRIHLEINGLDQRMDSTTELVLFRIVQELMGNIIKHAQATEVFIQLSRESGELLLCVEDNGVGFDSTNQKSGGVGLRNIQNRVAYLHGSVEIDSQPGRGCSVVVKVATVLRSA